MSLRPLVGSILIFIFIIIGVYEIYTTWGSNHKLYAVNSNLKWIGVVDMDFNHAIDTDRILKGEDVILAVDVTNPLYQEILGQIPSNMRTSDHFELSDFDANRDGIINFQDPIFQLLRVIVFNPNGQGYTVKSLPSVGIHAVKLRHQMRGENHLVVLSDSTTRELYELNSPGGVAIYSTEKGNQMQPLPPKPMHRPAVE